MSVIRKILIKQKGTIMQYCGYLDIETTGLSSITSDLTVIGLYLDDDKQSRFIQLVGNEISAVGLMDLMENISVMYTYNGSRFDLPFIKAKLGIDITEHCTHRDLMYECWQRNLYGGFKAVERKLGIERETTGIDGFIAVKLWYSYKYYGSTKSLETLLKYNKEDVLNLKTLRQKLSI